MHIDIDHMGAGYEDEGSDDSEWEANERDAFYQAFLWIKYYCSWKLAKDYLFGRPVKVVIIQFYIK